MERRRSALPFETIAHAFTKNRSGTCWDLERAVSAVLWVALTRGLDHRSALLDSRTTASGMTRLWASAASQCATPESCIATGVRSTARARLTRRLSRLTALYVLPYMWAVMKMRIDINFVERSGRASGWALGGVEVECRAWSGAEVRSQS
jgi:hypothetical protein